MRGRRVFAAAVSGGSTSASMLSVHGVPHGAHVKGDPTWNRDGVSVAGTFTGGEWSVGCGERPGRPVQAPGFGKEP